MTALGAVRRRVLGIPSARAVFRRPGFAWQAWERFAPVAESLMAGYHATLETTDLSEVADTLERVEPAYRGFAYEGAGMGLAALDALGPWRSRVRELAAGPAARHLFPFYVGVGLAVARLRGRPEILLSRLDPVLGWVTADGYGFHEAFFHRRATVDRHHVPPGLSSYGRRMFDQGVGRAIWFSGGADPERAAEEISAFEPARHPDLWGGVGLASTYGGGTDREGLELLLASAGPAAPRLALGAAVAAWGRSEAGNPTAHTALGCEVYADCSDTEAAAVVARAGLHLPATRAEPVHETWRDRIVAALADPDRVVSAPPVRPTTT